MAKNLVRQVAVFLLAALMVIAFSACRKGPTAPTDPNPEPPCPGRLGCPPSQEYSKEYPPAEEVYFSEAGTGFKPVPAGAFKIHPTLFSPARHDFLPRIDWDPLLVNYEFTVDARLVSGVENDGFEPGFLYVDANRQSIPGFGGTNCLGKYAKPGQTISCAVNTPYRNYYNVRFAEMEFYVRIRRPDGKGYGKADIPYIYIPVDWELP